MNDVLSVVGSIAGLISIAAVVYTFAFWRGRVDKELSYYREANILDRLTKIETKQEVVWLVFTEQILTNRPNLAMRGSEFKLTEDAMIAVEEVKELIPTNPGVKKVTSEHILVDLPKRIGLDKLKAIADKNKMTLGELLAIISVELGIDI